MTTVFGKGLRGRRKPEVEEEVAQIADEANLWWTRRDFVQNPVVRTRNAPAAKPVAPRAAPETPVVDPTLHGKAFSEVFTTESLFGREQTPPPPTPGHPGGTPEPRAHRAHDTHGAPGATAHARPTEAPAAGPAPCTPQDPYAGPADHVAHDARTPHDARDPRTAPSATGTPRDASAHGPAPHATAPAAGGPAPRPRPRIPLNHPLFPALELLGLDASASWHDVQQAYRRLAKTAHPDHSGDDGEAMADLNAAYMALRDARRYGIFDDD